MLFTCDSLSPVNSPMLVLALTSTPPTINGTFYRYVIFSKMKCTFQVIFVFCNDRFSGFIAVEEWLLYFFLEKVEMLSSAALVDKPRWFVKCLLEVQLFTLPQVFCGIVVQQWWVQHSTDCSLLAKKHPTVVVEQ